MKPGLTIADKVVIAVGVPAIFIAAHVTWFGSVPVVGSVVLIVLSVAIALRPSSFWLALVPLLLPLLGVLSWGDAFAQFALVLVGPLLVQGIWVSLEFVVKELVLDGPLSRAILYKGMAPIARLVVGLVVAIGAFGRLPLLGWLLLAVACVAFAFRRVWIAAAIGVVVALVWPSGALWSWFVVAAALVVVVWQRGAAPPKREIYLPATHESLTLWDRLRLLRCDRLLRIGDLLGARELVVPGAERGLLVAELRLTLIDVQEGYFDRALALGRRSVGSSWSEPVLRYVAWLNAVAVSGVGRHAEARARLTALDASCGPAEDRTFVNGLWLSAARNALAAGEPTECRHWASRVVDATRSARIDMQRLTAMGLNAEAALVAADAAGWKEWNDKALGELTRSRWIRLYFSAGDSTRFNRRLFGKAGAAILDIVRFDLLGRRAEVEGFTTRSAPSTWDPMSGVLAMSMTRRTDDLVDLLLLESRAAQTAGEMDRAVALGVRALMELDATRYDLAAQSNRTSWHRRFEQGLDVCLPLVFASGDHRLLAELLEFSRVQTLPAARGVVADLELRVPPAVFVRGVSRLSKPRRERPASIELEYAAGRMAGPGTAWLGFYEHRDQLYWALTPQEGSIWAGRISLQEGSDAAAALDALRQALPALLDGEEPGDVEFRIYRSPLNGADYARESALAERIGEALLPPQLATLPVVGEFRRVAIAPSASIGFVPWAVLGVKHLRRDWLRADLRLCEAFDWVLAPSAALAATATVSEAPRPRLSFVVADTTTGRNGQLAELEGAREQAKRLPVDVIRLGGSHWAEDVATPDAVETVLRRAGGHSTGFFFCHAVRGSRESPSDGGIVLASAAATDPSPCLTPKAVFAMSGRGIRAPAQVLLAACDTSALSDTASGEWLTIAPAFTAAGAREVVATLFPVSDIQANIDPLIDAAINGRSLAESLRETQRSCMRRWRSTQEQACRPIEWAAYAPIVVNGDETQGVPPTRFTASAAALLDRCADAANRQNRPLDTADLLVEYLESHDLAEYLDGAATSPSLGSMSWSITLEFTRWWARRRVEEGGGDAAGPTATVAAVLKTAMADAAILDGHVMAEHLVLGALADPRSRAATVLRVLRNVSRARYESVVRAVAHYQATEIAATGLSGPCVMPAELPAGIERVLN